MSIIDAAQTKKAISQLYQAVYTRERVAKQDIQIYIRICKTRLSCDPESWMWKSAEDPIAQWRTEGSSQMSVVHCTVPCKLVSGSQWVCNERLKDMCQKAEGSALEARESGLRLRR